VEPHYQSGPCDWASVLAEEVTIVVVLISNFLNCEVVVGVTRKLCLTVLTISPIAHTSV